MDQSIPDTPNPDQSNHSSVHRVSHRYHGRGRSYGQGFSRGRGRGSNRIFVDPRTDQASESILDASSLSQNLQRVEISDDSAPTRLGAEQSVSTDQQQIQHHAGRNKRHDRRDRVYRDQAFRDSADPRQAPVFRGGQRGNRRNFHSSIRAADLANDDGPINNICLGVQSDSTQAKQETRPHKIVPRKFMRDRNLTTTNDQDQDETAEVVQSKISENRFKNNSFECMICCDNIHRSNPIWYCTSCFNIFHMKCAVEWCNKSIKTRNEAIANSQFPSLGDAVETNPTTSQGEPSNNRDYPNYRQERQKSVEWPCPTCRKILHNRQGKYKCFCGKVVQPEAYHHLTPHSCGQLCGRKRPSAGCSHECDSLCHPGRCDPCQLVVTKSCYCGKSSKEVVCSEKVGSCNEVCGKSLACGRHVCLKVCHEGSCSPCNEILTLKCFCESKEITRRCGDTKKSNQEFSCDKTCDRILDCGKHRCQRPCHSASSCPSCPLLSRNLKTCPCGSKPISKEILDSRLHCTDPLPTCDSKCSRQLICGPEKNRHRCQKKCHIGSCPPCKQKSAVKCECSLSSKTVDCSLMFEKSVDPKTQELIGFTQKKFTFKCETRCNTPKTCGKHRCQEKCCDAGRIFNSRVHICAQVCTKKLPCGSHICQEVCHPGLCGDCTNIGWVELTCHCGSSVMYPPIPCGARPPACHRPCRRAHNCGHPVKHECHDDSERCAPCTVFVKKPCFCGSESKDSVYCYLPGYSCGRTCKKQLSCRQHVCKRVCHGGDCETPNERGVVVCSQPCPVTRYLCEHPCSLPCHGKTACPGTNCSRAIEITCECGNRKERIECYKLSKDADNRNKVAMMSMSRPGQESVVIDLSRKTPSSSTSVSTDASKKSPHTKLDCDETCAIYKRNLALAEALDIAKPDLKPAGVFGEDPLKLLREATVHDYKFVAATYNSLAKFVKSAKESEKRVVFLHFPPADKLKRQVIHELSYHFNCVSESKDEGSERFVVVRASRSKSCVPDFTVEQFLPLDE